MDPRDYASVMNAFPEPMLLLSARGDLLVANRAANRHIVTKLDEPQPNSILPHVEGDPRLALQFLRDCARSSQLIPGSITFRLGDESVRCRCDGARVYTADDQAAVMVLMRVRTQASASEAFVTLNEKISQLNREVAQRKRTEQALRLQTEQLLEIRDALETKTAQLIAQADDLRQAKVAAEQATRVKSQFLANMSHELRTPMNGILGAIQLLQTEGLPTEQSELISMLHSSSEQLLSLLNDILDTARVETGKLELDEQALDISELVDELMELFILPATNKGLRLTQRVSPALASRCYADAKRLRQVLMNLLGNAIKFTPKGTVELTASESRSETGEPTLRFEVEDTGIGIDPGSIDRIFDSFTQVDAAGERQFGGSGLGLSICQGLLTAMGGHIGVSSELGRGSRFWFEIPLRLEPGARGHEAPEHDDRLPALPDRSLRVLVAEDNTINQMVVRRMLERLGCTVHVVDDGIAAVDAASNNDYDLILMDIEMPRLGGLEATNQLRAQARCRQTPIVAITAHAFAENKARCLAAGMSDFISKPIELRVLQRALVEHTHRRSASASS